MSRSQNNNIFVWIGLCILLILPSIARTQSVQLTLFVTDSLTEENITNYSIYIDDSIVLPSLDETHAAHFVLDNAIDHTFRIRVHKFHYYDRKKQLASFFSNSKRGFHRIDILVGKPMRTKTKVQQCVNDIIKLYEEDLKRRNIQQTPDVLVHFYDLPEGEDAFAFEIEAFDYK